MKKLFLFLAISLVASNTFSSLKPVPVVDPPEALEEDQLERKLLTDEQDQPEGPVEESQLSPV